MSKPIHCGKPAKPYFHKYFEGKACHSFEYGFKCSVCGQIRLPTNEPFDFSYMNQMESVRLAGIEFDNQFN